jgi:hypothetical protein
VLVGGFGIDLSLNFMYSKTETDFLILKNIKVCEYIVVYATHTSVTVQALLLNVSYLDNAQIASSSTHKRDLACTHCLALYVLVREA